MTYHNAAKRILSAPIGSDRLASQRQTLLLRYLNCSHRGVSFVTVLGESGKSASATMLSHAVKESGYRTGLLSTPFSHTIRECINVDGEPISIEDFTACVSAVCEAESAIRADIASLPPRTEDELTELTDLQKSLYAYQATNREFRLFSDEILLASALQYFADTKCQIVILEIPNGTRADAYHLPYTPLVSVITATASSDAAKKICSRLMPKTVEIVSSPQPPEILRQISDRCATINCRLTVPLKNQFYLSDVAANRLDLFYKSNRYTLNSGAHYQAENLLTVLETLTVLKRSGLRVDPETAAYQPSFGAVGLPLQFTFLSLSPTVITDFADTPTRRVALAESLTYHKDVFGENVTLIAPCSDEDDHTVAAPFLQKGLPITTVVRTTPPQALRTMKPIAKALSPSDTLIILGDRPFVYELHRALIGLLP